MPLSELWDFFTKWENIPRGLVGKTIKTEQELKELFPQNSTFNQACSIGTIGKLLCEIYAKTNQLDSRFNYYIAYKCNSCDTIIIGMPKKNCKGYKCNNCDDYLGEF